MDQRELVVGRSSSRASRAPAPRHLVGRRGIRGDQGDGEAFRHRGVPLNIAEGSGKRSARDARRFYAITRGSALECAAIIDALEALGFVLDVELGEPRKLLARVVSMLTKMTC